MSDLRPRSYEPRRNPAPIIINREPEVRPPHREQAVPKQRAQGLTFRNKLYNLFNPRNSRTGRVIITETRTSNRRTQRIERSPSPTPLPRTLPTRVLDSSLQRVHRHSTSATMPAPHVPLPPRISPDAQPPRSTHQRQPSADTVKPVIEERSPGGHPRVYAHPYDVREKVVGSPPPENRQSVHYEINQPVRSRPPQTVEAQELARVRAESHHRSQQLDEAHTTIEMLRRQLAEAARETEQGKRRIARVEKTLGDCEEKCRLLEREKRVEAAEAQLAREKSAEARAALEQERQDRSRERALQAQRKRENQSQQRLVRRPTEVVQTYRPGEPRTVPYAGASTRLDTRDASRSTTNNPALNAIRRAQEDVRRGEST